MLQAVGEGWIRVLAKCALCIQTVHACAALAGLILLRSDKSLPRLKNRPCDEQQGMARVCLVRLHPLRRSMVFLQTLAHYRSSVVSRVLCTRNHTYFSMY